jgi:hypothetical protein
MGESGIAVAAAAGAVFTGTALVRVQLTNSDAMPMARAKDCVHPNSQDVAHSPIDFIAYSELDSDRVERSRYRYTPA